MTQPSASDVVDGWHAAVNSGDVEEAVQWCAPDVTVRGPRGTGQGHDLVRGWLTRSGIRLTPQEQLFVQDGRIALRELAQWTTSDAPAEAPTEPSETWCVFEVADGRLTAIERYESREEVPA